MFLYFAFYYCFSTIITLLLYAYSYWSDKKYYKEMYGGENYYKTCTENFNNPVGTIIVIVLLGYIIFPVLIYALVKEYLYECSIKK